MINQKTKMINVSTVKSLNTKSLVKFIGFHQGNKPTPSTIVVQFGQMNSILRGAKINFVLLRLRNPLRIVR